MAQQLVAIRLEGRVGQRRNGGARKPTMFVIRVAYPAGHSVWLTRRFLTTTWGPKKDALRFPTEPDAARVATIAVPMIGGMVSSTVLTLVVIPAVYGLVKGWGLAKARQPLPAPIGRAAE
jgi:hypothetical protein